MCPMGGKIAVMRGRGHQTTQQGKCLGGFTLSSPPKEEEESFPPPPDEPSDDFSIEISFVQGPDRFVRLCMLARADDV